MADLKQKELDYFSKIIARGVRTNVRTRNPFTEIVMKAYKEGIVPRKNAQSMKWFRDQASSIRSAHSLIDRYAASNDKGRVIKNPRIGEMVMYGYDPKHKDTLPYFDQYPVGFIVRMRPDGYDAINLHYLAPPYRAYLLDKLATLASDTNYDEKTRLKLSYSILDGARKYKLFAPCYKRYLNIQRETPIIRVYAWEWDIAAFLPLARFRKATTRRVWADSNNKVKV